MTRNWGAPPPQGPQPHPPSPLPPAYPPPQPQYPSHFGQHPQPHPQAVLTYRAGPCCPRCGTAESMPVKFTWWGGILGPKLLSHVRCNGCGAAYNGKTGKPNTAAIVVYSVVMAVIALVVLALIGGIT